MSEAWLGLTCIGRSRMLPTHVASIYECRSWLHQRMHGELAGAVVRDSAAAVQQVSTHDASLPRS